MTDAEVPADQPPSDVKPVNLEFNPSTLESNTMDLDGANGGPQNLRSGISTMMRRMKENANVILETHKPLSEFIDWTAMSKPASLGEVTSRLQKNSSYYRTNYFVLMLTTMSVVFLLHPMAILWLSVLVLMWAWLFLVHSGPLTIGGREYSDREKLIGASVVSFVVIFFLTNGALPNAALRTAKNVCGAFALHAKH